MSKITPGLKAEITRQSDVVSKNLRDNFSNYANAINDTDTRVDNIAATGTIVEVSDARPNHTVLKNRLDSIGVNQEDARGIINYKKSGGVVTINAGDTAKVDMTECQAKVSGIDIKVSAATSSAIPASAAGNHRVDVFIVQSDNTATIVTGPESLKASTNPAFPTIALTQLSLAAIYVDDTASVDVTGYIFPLKEDASYPNYYIKQATTINQGKYVFNNLIIDAAITVDCTSTTGFQRIQKQNVVFSCVGYFYNTTSGDISIATGHAITGNTNDGSDGVTKTAGSAGAVGLKTLTSLMLSDISYSSSQGGDGGTGRAALGEAEGGGGGGGAGSVVSPGGAGGDGGDVGGGVPGAADASGGTQGGISPLLLISAYGAQIDGDIINNGEDGGDGSDSAAGTDGAGGGAAGGSSGGTIVLLVKKDISISSVVTCNGGDGGDGGDATTPSTSASGGGGGGGGGGGLVIIRSLSYTNTGTVSASAGSAGVGGTASAASSDNGDSGSAGGAGLVDQALYSDLSSSLLDNSSPLNIFSNQEQ